MQTEVVPREDLGWWMKTLVLVALEGGVLPLYRPTCSGSGCETLARSLLEAYVRKVKPTPRVGLRAEDV